MNEGQQVAQWSWALDLVEAWYENYRNTKGSMATNVMTAGLIVAGMAKEGLPITDARLQSDGGSQVRGLSGGTVTRILKRHGETRRFTSEGGRTSRGTLRIAESLRDLLGEIYDGGGIDHHDLDNFSFTLEHYFVQKLQSDYFDKQAIEADIDPSKPVSRAVGEILREASIRADKPGGIVLQHLVGAKLELRFPGQNIGRDHANAADQQTSRQGDFEIGATAFHVTMSPMEKLMDRCKQNLHNGYRPVIIVPINRTAAAIQFAEMAGIGDSVEVIAAETFIGTNIEEIAGYQSHRIRAGLAELLFRYNDRVEQVEPDQSLRIEIPGWATQAGAGSE